GRRRDDRGRSVLCRVGRPGKGQAHRPRPAGVATRLQGAQGTTRNRQPPPRGGPPRTNDCVHLPAGCKERDVSKNRDAGPSSATLWFGLDSLVISSGYAFLALSATPPVSFWHPQGPSRPARSLPFVP